ncbi:pyruvate dehydrogenase E2 component (dihydrolipoamide acetyltransferase) [Breoghania corrubedonensis]|uniref:Acetyltransferase component of pyruvate dehydrogenase complex n=1 Tax=Breoghania corrubedonensis TaxID=665038 RepID=A0A2T5V929_9HYPH|nr:pyruvate dehydrogenase complex dihydrolipoamide acetyltransferase [Breoghania corrubedonensis]PTW60263.1 pyruvate dehydrogenase E2 component (dihydrolipoamide acetyltransferase) [Breoghania corrubedonensis]
MPIDILMPALSPTMEEGKLAKWLVKEGDTVSSGDVIAEIETDKATMEVEAVDEGTVGKILVPDDTEGVKVNARIAILLEEGEDASAISDAGSTGSAKPAPQAEKADAPKAEKTEAASADGAAKTSAPPEGGKAGPVPRSNGERVFASPLARRIAALNDLDITAVKGSGPRGRIVQRDVEAAMKSGAAKPAAAEASPAKAAPQAAGATMATPPSDDAVLKLFEDGSYELVPHDGMRKTIARRLTESKQTVPHFYLTADCNIDALLALRAQLNSSAPKDKDGNPAYKLSVNDMIIKAQALALKAVPEANASWTEANMVIHKHADVGVAVSIPGGLITPIIRRAEEKTLSTISNEMKGLAKRAKDRKLQPSEYQGGSTAVSNLGMFGVRDFYAVINPPHATILAVGAGEKRAIVKDDAVAIATMMTVTLATDHRAVDGALGAQLLKAFKGFIESPMSMLV